MQSSVPQDFFVQWQVEGLLYSLLTNDLFCVLGNVYCFTVLMTTLWFAAQ